MSTAYNKETLEKLVNILTEIEASNDLLKSFKEDCKEKEISLDTLLPVAKAIVKGKLTELKQKTTNLLETIEEVA